jgi:hypothetical protein
MILQVPLESFILNSWQLVPMDGIGLECGRPIDSPRCRSRNRYPASILASGVIRVYVRNDIDVKN